MKSRNVLTDKKMSKLYTKTGDEGTTSLYDVKNMNKDDPIFEALGDLDELSAHIGLLYTKTVGIYLLRKIQSKLLDIGSDISTMRKRDKVVPITEDDVSEIERQMDEWCDKTSPLTEFILVGSGEADATAHICRAVCRRAERHLWKARRLYVLETGDETFKYINRLSDMFFALGRFLSERGGLREIRRSEYQK